MAYIEAKGIHKTFGKGDAAAHKIEGDLCADLAHDQVLVALRDEGERHRLFRLADPKIIQDLRMCRPRPRKCNRERHGAVVDDLFEPFDIVFIDDAHEQLDTVGKLSALPHAEHVGDRRSAEHIGDAARAHR